MLRSLYIIPFKFSVRACRISLQTCLLLIAYWLLLLACNNKPQPATIASDSYYTCSMHPQVMNDKPGNCPICHMELIVVKKTSTAANEIVLNDEQIRLGNIRADTLHDGVIDDQLVLTATLSTDETKTNNITARVMGRIDRLYFKSEGDFVAKGAHLYDLYSEELNNAQQEYIALLEKRQTLGNAIIDFDRLLQSAKTKLLLWGMSEAQVAALADSKKSSALTAFYSTASGYIAKLPVTEGQYVTEGDVIAKLANTATVWAEAQVYASQLSAINKNGTVIVTFPDLPGKTWNGKVEFVNPEISPGTRVNLIRVAVPNQQGQLKPGMPAYVRIKGVAQKTLTLPSDAVLRDGRMNVVWVQHEKNSFSRKMVEIGMESGDRVEIKSGLRHDDVVVTSGAYLLNSEFIFKKGGDMGGHQH